MPTASLLSWVVAQQLEWRASDLEVVGSNPAMAFIYILLSFPTFVQALLNFQSESLLEPSCAVLVKSGLPSAEWGKIYL